MAKKEKKPTGREIEQALEREYARWEHLRDQGGQDPFWADGCSMNLVRNHIIGYRMQLEELEYFPEVYKREIPPAVDACYMARKSEIMEHAERTLEQYHADKNYQYLEEHGRTITEAEAKGISLWNVLGYERGLKEAIKKKDFIVLRQHESKDRYLEAFASCRKSLEDILSKKQIITEKQPENVKLGQLTIFDCFGISLS